MTAQDDEKHDEQEENRAKTGTSRWTAEAIRALGAITDLQTLADIFGCSVWMSRKMARTGEWERQGIKIIRIGVHYRVGVGSILDVLGFSSGDLSTPGPSRSQRDTASPAELAGRDFPAPLAGRSVPRQKPGWLSARCARAARPESSTREAAPMTAQDDEKHYEQEENRAKTGNSKWTAEAIRALGATTDLQTLADIFGCSGWSSRKMARTGEWERQGIKIFRIGAHYRVGVGSILDVLGFSSGDLSTPGTAHAGELDQADGNATDSAVTQASGSVAAGAGR